MFIICIYNFSIQFLYRMHEKYKRKKKMKKKKESKEADKPSVNALVAVLFCAFGVCFTLVLPLTTAAAAAVYTTTPHGAIKWAAAAHWIAAHFTGMH